jgi:methionyl aminopeptidase
MKNLKSEAEIAALREGGRILSDILRRIVAMAVPGATTDELEAATLRFMSDAGGEPSFKGYRTSPRQRPFPSALCLSLNSEVVHAPALPRRILKDGDLLKIDVGLRYKGLYTDMATTVAVGRVSRDASELVEATRQALEIGISKAVAGGWISDIGKAIDRHLRRHGYSAVRDLVGHGVGYAVHEEPSIPNYFDRRAEPVEMAPGMVLAIEPMVNFGSWEVATGPDGWTVLTADGSLSAHFEATVAVTEHGTEIITPIV